MFPGLNPKKMQAVMKQMGISQDEISCSKVIIEKEDGGKIVVENPSVVKIKMQGQESFQITGDISEENPEVGISQEDINAVVEKTGCTCEQAEKVLKQTGDLAEAILELSVN
jgi:nascent polypeptide-associated complex subunit alpha